MKQKLVVVGGAHLHHYAAQFNADGRFEVLRVSAKGMINMAPACGEEIIAIITELWMNHGRELKAKETHRGEIAGAVLVEKLLPQCRNAKFFIVGGYADEIITRFKKQEAVVLFHGISEFSPQRLLQAVYRKLEGI